MITVGLDTAAVEADLRSGRLGCTAAGCEAVLGPWGWARERLVRGAGRLQPRRGRCRGCRRSQVLLPASVLLRRAVLSATLGGAHRVMLKNVCRVSVGLVVCDAVVHTNRVLPERAGAAAPGLVCTVTQRAGGIRWAAGVAGRR